MMIRIKRILKYTRKRGIWFLLLLFLTLLIFILDGFVCPSGMVCICTDLRIGRLGNRLYALATAYSLAKSKGLQLFVAGGDSELKSLFDVAGSYMSTHRRCSFSFLKNIRESACCTYSPLVKAVPPNTSITLDGYFQSYKYFEQHEHEIRRLYSIHEDILYNARKTLDNMLKNKFMCHTNCNHFHRTLVGIHIRRGDYTKQFFVDYGYRTAPKEYLFKAQDYMRNHFSSVIFIVFSTDIEWSKNVFVDQNDVIISPRHSATLDMALLTLMNHTIITVGTFGFWAAWLNQNNGTVIYYKDMFTPKSEYGVQVNIKDTYYSHWIGL